MKRLVLIAVLASVAMLFHSAAFAMGPEHTGSWYNAGQSGHGFSIEYGATSTGTPLVVVYWYVYDKDGSPVFLTGTGNPDATGVDIAFYAHHGMKFGSFDPMMHQEPDGGVARFTFTDDKNGTFEYFPSTWTMQNFGHVQHQMSITKLFAVTHPNVEPPPPPFSALGRWSGRMVYDRRSAAGKACYDADAQVGVSATGNGILLLNSITVRPDTGGLYIVSGLSLVMSSGVVSGNYTINGQRINYTIDFFNDGHAEGLWTYDNSQCYGEWTFTKD